MERADGNVVAGQINEVRIGRPTFGPFVNIRPWHDWHWLGDTVRNPFGGSFDLVATLVRIGLVGLLAALMIAVLPSSVRRVADRVSAEPWRAGLVGLAAQLLFVPLLIITIVVLAVSIIGIPLLLLVPFGLIFVAVALVMDSPARVAPSGAGSAAGAGSGMPGLVRIPRGGSRRGVRPDHHRQVPRDGGLPVGVVIGGVLAIGFLVEVRGVDRRTRRRAAQPPRAPRGADAGPLDSRLAAVGAGPTLTLRSRLGSDRI